MLKILQRDEIGPETICPSNFSYNFPPRTFRDQRTRKIFRFTSETASSSVRHRYYKLTGKSMNVNCNILFSIIIRKRRKNKVCAFNSLKTRASYIPQMKLLFTRCIATPRPLAQSKKRFKKKTESMRKYTKKKENKQS